MRSRTYVTAPRAKTRKAHEGRARADSEWHDVNAEDYLARVVFDAEEVPQPTGLLDQHGNELFRIEPPMRIGFVIWEEDDDEE